MTETPHSATGTAPTGTALVTGAAKRIGAGLARALAAAGWQVCVHYASSAKDAETVVADIEKAGARAVAIPADLAEPEAAERLLAEAALPGLRLRLHPSLGLLASPFPVVSIWQAHPVDDPAPLLAGLPSGGECAMVLRPALDVEIHTPDARGFAFVRAFRSGATLAEAIEAVEAVSAGDDKAGREAFDFSAHLAALFEAGAVIGLTGAQEGETTS